MKTKLRLLSGLMVLIMLITNISIGAFAEDDVTVTSDDAASVSVNSTECQPEVYQEGEADGEYKIEIDNTLGDDEVLVNLKGVSITKSKEDILKQINKYRKEACEKGYPDPRDPSRKLTASDYTPIKWSAEMEALARVRAAESSVYLGHERPNGKSCFSLRLTSGMQSYGEVLAWNGLPDEETTLYGIGQWYGEKSDWVKQVPGKVTGHYTMMIDPSNSHIGISSFRSYLGGWTSTAGEFNSYNAQTENKDSSAGDITVPIVVNKKFIKKIGYSDNQKKSVAIGGTLQLSLRAIANFESKYKTIEMEGKVTNGVSWYSSNEQIASVSPEGVVTGVSEGVAVITGEVGGKTYSINVTAGNIKGGKLDISGVATVSINSSYVYTKGGCKPTIDVYVNGRLLTKNKDYKVKYKNYNTSRGTVIITGKKSYKGKMTYEYDIVNQKLENVDTYIKDAVWKDTPDNYKLKAVLTDLNGKKLKAGKDYDSQYEYFYSTVSGNIIRRLNPGETAEAGKYIKAVIKPVPGGHYDGEASYVYRLVNTSISKAKVKMGLTYNISDIKAEMLDVSYKGQPLRPGIDYEIQSSVINKKCTKLTIVIHGLGDYGLTKKVVFKIK